MECIPESCSGTPEQIDDAITCGLGLLEGCPEVDLSDDVDIINEDVTKTEGTIGKAVNSLLNVSAGEDFELQAMFYLPEWRSPYPPPFAELHPERDESLKVILANVEALLSRSPPPVIEDSEANVGASPQTPLQPFHVSFTLDLDDYDEEVMPGVLDSDTAMPEGQENRDLRQSHARVQQSPSRGETPAGGLTWDAIFDDEDEDDCFTVKQADQNKDGLKVKGFCINKDDVSCWDGVRDKEVQELTDGLKDDSQMDNSMDLFGDDEAFLQMTIPDIPTPGVRPQSPCTATDAHGGDATTNASADGLHVTVKAQHNTGRAVASGPQADQSSLDQSCDLFSVNFDLGYSMEDSDEDTEEPGPAASTSALPLKQADSSTPNSYFHNKPVQSREPQLSTPQMPSEHRRREASSFFASPLTSKGDAFLSPITSTRARRTILAGSSPGTRSLRASLKRKRLCDGVDEESVSAALLSPHLGRFFHQEI